MSQQQLEQGQTFYLRGDSGSHNTILQVAGELNGKTGVFEYILNSGNHVTHQLFKPGGVINGIPS